MNETRRPCSAAAALVGPLCLVFGAAALADPAATVIDSQHIIHSLSNAPASNTRGLVVAERPAAAGDTHRISLDIRFANNSDRLTEAAHAQLAELGSALTAPELAHSRFLIAGHTSATGAAGRNQRLSESRARAVRGYLLEHFHIEPARLTSVGYGAEHPLPDFPPSALEQRRVEISTLPARF
jgi:outer membrane protein OmpA-like peptidoglycan-associated protein